jgi:hypothetical protein
MLQSWTLTAYSRAVLGCDPTRVSGLPAPEGREHLWRPLPLNSAQLIYQRLSRREDGVSIPPRTLTAAVLNLGLYPAHYPLRRQHAERLMLSHGYGWHDLLRSRRRDSRSRWLQRLVRPGR